MASTYTRAAQIIGDRVRDARLALGISMEDLSILAEVSVTTISKTERGIQSPTTETLTRLSTALGIDPGSVLAGVTADDYGPRNHQLTAREFVLERQARMNRG